VAKIIERESTNLQWDKLALNFGMLLILFVLTLLRGPGDEPSLIGVVRCDPMDWVLFSVLIALSVVVTVIVLVILRREYAEKKGAGYTFVVGDFKCTN
jgi:uncharacterized membrane protein YfcA